MEFRIADTFTESLAKLTGAEQRASKTTAFDLQISPAQPGLQFHRVDRARDRNFWSVRVNRSVRMVVHKTAANLLLCYVRGHDEAYRWAERQRLEQHPHTGAAQLVEIREGVREVEVPRYVVAERRVFASVPDTQLMNYGVPAEWLDDVKQVADEDALLALADHLPAEAAEALLELATGSSPERPVHRATDGDPLIHLPIPMLNAASESCPTRKRAEDRRTARGARDGRRRAAALPGAFRPPRSGNARPDSRAVAPSRPACRALTPAPLTLSEDRGPRV